MKVWTTADRPKREQYSYWREVICEAFTALDPVVDSPASFESLVIEKELANLAISDARSKSQSVIRGSHEISRNPSSLIFVNLLLEGQCLVRQDGRETLIRAGDFSVVDTTRPFQQEYEDWHVICVRIPRHVLTPLLSDPLRCTAVRLTSSDGGLGSIAGSFIRSLQDCPVTIDAKAKDVLASSLLNLLAIALGGTQEARERGRVCVRQGLRDAIVRYVKSNIADPGLSVFSAASKFHVSPRYLHKLFEETDQSFTQVVIEERLQRCAAELSAPGSQMSISEIATRFGFGDFSHFSRSFRKRFGMSARDFRSTFPKSTECA